MKCSTISIFFLLLAVACSDDPASTPTVEVSSVSFNAESKIDIKENDTTTVLIPFALSESQKKSVSVTYEVIDVDVVEGSDFTILTKNPIVIPAGSTVMNLALRVNDNTIVQPEERKIYLRIRSIDPPEIKIKVPKEVVISIEDDDCLPSAPNLKIWIGALTIQNENEVSQATGLEGTGGLCSGTFKVKGKFLGSENPESTVVVELTQDATNKMKGATKVTRSKLFDFTSQYEFEAVGTYDEQTKKITMNYSFYDLLTPTNNYKSTLTITSP